MGGACAPPANCEGSSRDRRPAFTVCPSQRWRCGTARSGTKGESKTYPELIKAHFGMVGGELIGRGEVRPENGERLLRRRAGLLGSLHRRGRGGGRSRDRQGRRCAKSSAWPMSARRINPRMVEAQEMGGACKGSATPSTKRCCSTRPGTLRNATLYDYHVPTIEDVPDRFVSNIVENARWSGAVRSEGRRRGIAGRGGGGAGHGAG